MATFASVSAGFLGVAAFGFFTSYNFPKQNEDSPDNTFDVFFIGTGSSNALPAMSCLMKGDCDVCENAVNTKSKNNRNNVSIGIKARINGEVKTILVDCGKTFRNAIVKHAKSFNLSDLDCLLVTHDHADAMGGFDDIRECQRGVFSRYMENGKMVGLKIEGEKMKVISNEKTLDYIKQRFPYLSGNYEFVRPGVLMRRVAYLEYIAVENDAQLKEKTCGLPVKLFPVYHGGDYISLGFSFGETNSFVYISDISGIPEESLKFLKSIPCIKVLVVDCLNITGYSSHFGLEQALDFVKLFDNVEKSYFVGMTCKLGDHDFRNNKLREEENIDVQLAHDGLYLHNFSCF